VTRGSDGPLDQLVYTWSARGLQNIVGFQPIAVSEGLQTLTARPVRDALRLCRYTAPRRRGAAPDEGPVAFGWLDQGDLRVAFQRTPVGTDGRGRPGNLCAHLLVGKPEDLPPDRLCRIFGSAFWCSTRQVDPLDPERQKLDKVSLEEISAGELTEPDEERGHQLVTALLSSTPRRAVAAPWEPHELIAGLTDVLDRAPGLLAGRGVSTFENTDLARSFGVVAVGPSGSAGGAVAVPVASPKRGVAELATELGRGPQEAPFAHIALEVAAAHAQPVDPRDVLSARAALDEVAATGVADRATVERISGQPKALRLFLGHELGISAVASVLGQLDDTVWGHIQTAVNAGALTAVLSQRLGTAVADGALRRCHAHELDDLASWARGTSPHLDAGLLDGVAQAVGRRPADAAAVSPALAFAVLDRNRRSPAPRLDPLLEVAAREPARLADRAELPVAWRARLLTAALADRRLPAATVAGLLEHHTDIAATLTETVSPEDLGAVVAKAPPTTGTRLLSRLLPALPEPVRRQTFEVVRRRASGRALLHLVGVTERNAS